MQILPFFFLPKVESREDDNLQGKVFSKILDLGKKGRGPILQDVLTNPEGFGVKGLIRQELIKVVMNTLNKAGFVGANQDFAVQRSLEHVLRIKSQHDDGGFF